MRRAWLLNLDADDELSGHSLSAHAQSTLAPLQTLVAKTLLIEDDVLLEQSDSPLPDAARTGLEVWCWAATPRARRLIKQRKLRGSMVPPWSVTHRAMRRDYAAKLGPTTVPKWWLCDLAAVQQWLARPASEYGSADSSWRLSRMHTASGRGHRVAREFAAVERWVRHTLARDGCVELSPLLSIAQEFALHGWIDRDGECTLGEPTTQQVASGQWTGSRLSYRDELSAVERSELYFAANHAAKLLSDDGYWGAFALDAMRFVHPQRGTLWCPCSELNTRFTMGWATGMADRRPDYHGR